MQPRDRMILTTKEINWYQYSNLSKYRLQALWR